MISQVSVTIQVAGGEQKTYTFPNAANPYPPQNTSSPSLEQVFTLTSTPQSITIPAGAQYLVLWATSQSGAANAITLRGASGDTGFCIYPGNVAILPVPPIVSFNYYLACGGSQSVQAVWV